MLARVADTQFAWRDNMRQLWYHCMRKTDSEGGLNLTNETHMELLDKGDLAKLAQAMNIEEDIPIEIRSGEESTVLRSFLTAAWGPKTWSACRNSLKGQCTWALHRNVFACFRSAGILHTRIGLAHRHPSCRIEKAEEDFGNQATGRGCCFLKTWAMLEGLSWYFKMLCSGDFLSCWA